MQSCVPFFFCVCDFFVCSTRDLRLAIFIWDPWRINLSLNLAVRVDATEEGTSPQPQQEVQTKCCPRCHKTVLSPCPKSPIAHRSSQCAQAVHADQALYLAQHWWACGCGTTLASRACHSASVAEFRGCAQGQGQAITIPKLEEAFLQSCSRCLARRSRQGC